MDTDKLAELLAKATPGPWRVSTVGLMNNGARAVSADDCRIGEIDCHAEYKRGQGWLAECDVREANAALIALAPDLAAEVLRLRAENAALRERVGAARGHISHCLHVTDAMPVRHFTMEQCAGFGAARAWLAGKDGAE